MIQIVKGTNTFSTALYIKEPQSNYSENTAAVPSGLVKYLLLVFNLSPPLPGSKKSGSPVWDPCHVQTLWALHPDFGCETYTVPSLPRVCVALLWCQTGSLRSLSVQVWCLMTLSCNSRTSENRGDFGVGLVNIYRHRLQYIVWGTFKVYPVCAQGYLLEQWDYKDRLVYFKAVQCAHKSTLHWAVKCHYSTESVYFFLFLCPARV